MNLTSLDHRLFARWFELLAKQKLGGALLPVSGIWMGLFLAFSGHIMPREIASYVSWLGFFMMSSCIALYLAFAAIHLWRIAQVRK
jgi:hypothetical protein